MFLLFVINLIFKMLKTISNKIQLGNTFNLLDDQTGVPSINDEGTLENFIGKVDKVWDFLKTGKADGDLSRYFLKILPITRQSQTDGELPMKAFAYKYAFAYVYALRIQIKLEQLEFILDLTASTCSNYSSMEICFPLTFTEKVNTALQMDTQIMTEINFLDLGLLILI